MKVKIEKSALIAGLQVVQNVVSPRTTLPILYNVLMVAENNGLTLTATDLDMTVRCTVKAEVEKGGSITLPARRLFSIVKELGDTHVELTLEDSHNVTLSCGSSYFKIMGMAADEFPALSMPEGEAVYRMEQGAFREMLRKTFYAASTEETRYILNGVLASFKEGKLTMVATDGRRLALVEQELDFPKEAEADMVLPSKAVTELLHTLGGEGDMKLYGEKNQMVFEFGNIVMATKLIEGSYPNYRQVIPPECEERIAVERESLLTALRRVSLVTTDKTNATKLTFAKNRLVVSTVTPEVGEARESVPVKYEGKQITVAFNPEFVMDPLKNMTNDEIYFELTDDLSPGVIKCDMPFLYVLMPIRIS
jgi:DNA polymerase III subunit beta